MMSVGDHGFEGVLVRELIVEDTWIDCNDHMNVAYYLLAFDLAVDSLWEQFGLDGDYRASRGGSTFAVECHVRYLRELTAGDPVAITAQLIAHDQKRIHQFQRMYHASEAYLAATCEWLNLHVDLTTRRVTPWPAAVARRIAEFATAHADLPLPEGLGSVIRVPVSRQAGNG